MNLIDNYVLSEVHKHITLKFLESITTLADFQRHGSINQQDYI